MQIRESATLHTEGAVSPQTHADTCSHTGNVLGDGSCETFDVVNQEKQGMKKQAKTNGAVHRRGSKGAKTVL